MRLCLYTLHLLFYGNSLEYLMNTQINVDETLVNKAAALAHNISQEDIVTIALRELIDTTN